MVNMNDQLKDAKLIVSIFNTFVPNCAAIAGGYIRDVETGREPRDIDIIVEFEDQRDFAEATLLADRLGYSSQVYHACAEYPNTARTGASVGVVKLHKHNQLDIDIIFKSVSVKRAIEDFPCNAVKVYLDGDTTITTEEYREFCKTRKLIFHPDAPQAYKDKLISYYPQDSL